MIPDVDLAWSIAFWIVLSAAVLVSAWAAVVLVIDFRASRHAIDPPAPVRVSRPPVDLAAKQAPPLVPLPRLRPHDPRFHHRVN
jgi:hypothetical protein